MLLPVSLVSWPGKVLSTGSVFDLVAGLAFAKFKEDELKHLSGKNCVRSETLRAASPSVDVRPLIVYWFWVLEFFSLQNWASTTEWE